jgi:hypothetical protein
MTTKPARQSHPVDAEGQIVPLPDPPRNPDGMQQLPHISRINLTLDAYYRARGRNDVLVNGEGYLCTTPGARSNLVVPDCVVAFGVDPEAITNRNGYVIEEVGKPPDLVLEVGSSSTGRNDYLRKPGIYAGYGIAEYWRFDPTGGKHHRAPLAGDRLAGGEYFPIALSTTEDGIIWGHSRILGLDVCWDKGRLRFYDPRTGEYLLDYSEAIDQRDAAITALADSQSRADAEAERADAEARRADAAEAELRRLREQLRREETE